MHLVRLLLIVSLLLPITAAAKTVTVRGEGNASCSSWTQEHALGSNRQRDQDSWLLGYVNATSVMLDIPGIEDVSAPLSNSDFGRVDGPLLQGVPGSGPNSRNRCPDVGACPPCRGVKLRDHQCKTWRAARIVGHLETSAA